MVIQQHYGSGIYFYAQQPLNRTQAFLHFRDIPITNTRVHHNELAGVLMADSYGYFCEMPHGPAYEKVLIDHVQAHDQIPRDNWPFWHSRGQGILLYGVRDALIQHSRAFRNGRSDQVIASGGEIGVFQSDRVLMQYNEVFDNRSGGNPGAPDMPAFGFERWTSNSIMQFN